ncbi:MAG: hypothetical protein ACWA5W_00315 [Phycisphaerales bacterium]
MPHTESPIEPSASETPTTASAETIFDSSSMYWKMCTMVLGIGFVIAVASHGGPTQASADALPAGHNVLSLHQQQARAIQQAGISQRLSIGGFDSIDGTPAFVIVNEDGQRIGTLPMNSVKSNTDH